MTRFALAVFLTLTVGASASGFNALGHKVVADIAWRELEPATRRSIVEVLRRHPRFDADFAAKMVDDTRVTDRESQDRWIFLHASTWPDVARGLPAGERAKYDRPTWHYINFPLYLDGSDRRALAPTLSVNLSTAYPGRVAPEDYNVLQAIAYSRDVLGQRKTAPDAKALAYCWLLHLVGDIHQPLHSTALFSVNRFPTGDRGGNEIPLRRGENLHKLWDNLLGRQHYLRNVDTAVADLSDRRRFGDVWGTAARERNPRKWAEESHALCESFVYSPDILTAVRESPPDMKLTPITLPDAYMKEAGYQARRRVVAAGLRLAALLQGVAP
jgi:hypothetical protein